MVAVSPKCSSAAAASVAVFGIFVQLLARPTRVDGLYETNYDLKMQAKSENCQFYRYEDPAVEKEIRREAGRLVRAAATSAVSEYGASQVQSGIVPFGSIERFVLFFGHQRTGHSYIGAVIDGAPDTLVSNEWNVLSKFHQFPDMTRTGLFIELAVNSIRCSRYGRLQAYNYSIPGSWQGQIALGNVLRIIGDKKGGTTTKLTYRYGIPFLNSFMERVALPFECIYVIRNPFDMIATVMVHHTHTGKWKLKGSSNRSATTEKPSVTEEWLKWAEESVGQNMNLTTSTTDVITRPHRWHVFFMEDFSERTTQELPRLCKLIGLTCPDSMIPIVDAATHHAVHRSRSEAKWTRAQVNRVDALLRAYPMLYKRYGPGNGLDGEYPETS